MVLSGIQSQQFSIPVFNSDCPTLKIQATYAELDVHSYSSMLSLLASYLVILNAIFLVNVVPGAHSLM